MRDLRSINKAVNPNGSRRARKQLAEARKEGVTGPFGWVFICRAFLYAGVSQRVPELFRLCRLCRYPGAAGELCISEIKRLKTHNCRITRNIDYHVTRFGDHPLSTLARAFHAHGFIGSEQEARYFVC